MRVNHTLITEQMTLGQFRKYTEHLSDDVFVIVSGTWGAMKPAQQASVWNGNVTIVHDCSLGHDYDNLIENILTS